MRHQNAARAPETPLTDVSGAAVARLDKGLPRLTFTDVFDRMQTCVASAAELPQRIPPSKRVPVATLATTVTTGAVIGGIAGGLPGILTGATFGFVTGLVGAAILKMRGWSPQRAEGEHARASRAERLYEAVHARLHDASADVTLAPVHDSPLRSPEMRAAVDRVTGAPLTSGNDVRLLSNGVQSFDARFRLMAAATRSIHLQTYIFRDDEAGRRTADLLRQKAREGVDVRVIVDGIGSQDTSTRFFDDMRADGVKVISFKPLSSLERLNHRWHQKVLTVDDGAAVLGGMNIGSEYALHGTGHVDVSNGADAESAKWMRDADVAVTGPVVVDAVHAFAESWALAGGEPLHEPPHAASPPAAIGDASMLPVRLLRGISDPVSGADTRLLVHRPYEDGDTRIEDWYVTMLDHASTTAYLTNAYFVPTPRITEALKRAAARGVDVRVLTNSPDTTDAALPMAQWAARASYEQLLKAGVRIYETPDTHQVLQHLHKKAAVFDGVVSTVGSYNLDPRSASLNSESTLVVENSDFGAQMNRMFAHDLKASREMSVELLRNGTLYDRVQQWFYGEVVRNHL